MDSTWQSLLDRFLAQAHAHPERLALADEASHLTYGETARQAGQLAGVLARLGAGREAVVALALPRSPAFVVAALASWWAGAAFVPVDPALPPRRRSLLLRDARARMVVTTSDLAGAFAPEGLPVVDVESGGDLTFPPCAAGPGDLAYVIFTSGSTGQPKGVAVEHRGLVPMLDAQVAAFNVRAGDRPLWMLSPSFDASISDLGTALCAGATLHVLRPGELHDLRTLLDALHRWQITHVDLPPALLPLLDPGDMPATLRTVVVGGEACSPDVVRRWAARLRIVNVYGPTEATVCTSLGRCDPESWTEPLLGQPLPGIRYHVLDEQRRLTESGELYIEGDCLAREYLAQPELTAERFVFVDGRRMYRTGDRVRRRKDGEYVFLGRVDRQVKVRGRLVEPGEVEACLRSCPGVAHAAVVKRPVADGDEALVAFVELTSSAANVSAIREHLRERLPAWMVPARVVAVPRMPRTASGKIDLAALVSWPLTSGGAPAETKCGSSDLRARLSSLCRDVLGWDHVNWQARFLEQGGDSLGLLRLVASADARGLTIPPSLVADRPMAEVLDWLARGGRRGLPPGAMSTESLRDDAAAIIVGLPGSAVVPDMPARSRSGRLFLTGATGALGSYLLVELLRRTEAEIVCLVRAGSVGEGRERLARATPTCDGGLADRVRVVLGDLRSHRLGLNEEAWERLGRQVDAVYHCAARVNLLLPYEQLRSDNVRGTAEVMRLSATGRPKALHYVSTLSVFVAGEHSRGVLREDDHLGRPDVIHGGYAQSKWAAEWLLRRAGGMGGRVVFYRPGLVTGDARTGKSALGDFLSLFLRGVMRLGCVPEIDASRLFVDVTPIDYCAAALAHLSLAAGRRHGDTFHLAGAGRASLQSLIEVLRSRGVRLETVSPSRWRERLGELERAAPDAAAACLALCRALPDAGGFAAYRTMDLFQATDVTFDMANTLAGLAGSGIACPPPSPELLGRYLDHVLTTRPVP